MKKIHLTWLVLAIGFSLTFMFCSNYRDWEQSHIQTEFKGLGDRSYLAISDVLHSDFLTITSIRSFFESSNHVDHQDFQSFTAPFLEKIPSIQALEWIPRVSHSDRSYFEARQRKFFPQFQIRERTDQGEMNPRQHAEEYFPVTYLEPVKGNEMAIGFDLASNTHRLKALMLSRQEGKALATEGVKLLQDSQEEKSGFLLFEPVYKTLDGEKTFIGFALGVFQVCNIINSALKNENLNNQGIGVKLEDVSVSGHPQKLYQSSGYRVDDQYSYEKNFHVAGRQWKLTLVPGVDYIDNLLSHIPLIGALVGTIFSLLLFIYLRSILTQSEQINLQVKKRTIELETNREELETVINTVEDGIVMINMKGTVQLFNPAAEKIFKYESSEVIGRNVNMLMPEPFHSQHDGYLHNYITSGSAKIIGIGREVKGKRKDGTTFPLRLAVNKMMIGNNMFFVGAVTDITVEKDAKQKLIKAKEKAEEANRLKSDFLNTMSHELRTPLTIILGNIDELTDEEEVPEPDEVAEIAQDCAKAGKHLMQLINDLLDISKIEAGKMTLLKESVHSGEIIAEVANHIKALTDQKGLNLSIEGDERELNIDHIRIKQVLLNLLSNAVKFTENGGISIISRVEKDCFSISVKDTGCGMDEENLNFIFDPFRQVDSSSVRKIGGTGLGLAITKKLVELHKGNIQVESQLGKGSIFTVFLPLD